MSLLIQMLTIKNLINLLENKYTCIFNLYKEIMKQTISEKETRLQEILLKILSLKNLMTRNKENSNLPNIERIHFPFIALELECDPNKNSVIFN